MFEIGSTLREARQRRGYDLARCEQGTKIRAKYLRAMEDEQFDVLPAPTYVRGFLRSYAEFLDLDWQLVLDEYESRFGGFGDLETDIDGSARAHRRPRPPGAMQQKSPEARMLWLAMGGVLAVALLVWVGAGGSSDETVSVPPPPPAAAQPANLQLRLQGVGAGTTYAVRNLNESGKILATGRLQPGATKGFPFRTTIWVQVRDPTGVKVTVNGEERLLITPAGYLISSTGQKLAGGASGGG
jgi:cytoskeleton protein RodZ